MGDLTVLILDVKAGKSRIVATCLRRDTYFSGHWSHSHSLLPYAWPTLLRYVTCLAPVGICFLGVLCTFVRLKLDFSGSQWGCFCSSPPPWGHLVASGDICGYHNLAGDAIGIQWVMPAMLQNVLRCTGQLCPPAARKNHPAKCQQV